MEDVQDMQAEAVLRTSFMVYTYVAAQDPMFRRVWSLGFNALH